MPLQVTKLLMSQAAKIVGRSTRYLLTQNAFLLVASDYKDELLSALGPEGFLEIPKEEVSFFINNFLLRLMNEIELVGSAINWQTKADLEPQKQLYLREEGGSLKIALHFQYDAYSLPFSPSLPRETISLTHLEQVEDENFLNLTKLLRLPEHEGRNLANNFKCQIWPKASKWIQRAWGVHVTC